VGQVPVETSYLIIGAGRLARHLLHLLRSSGIPHAHWHRGLSEDQLKKLLPQNPMVLLAIRDDAIVPFFTKHRRNANTFIHFSGALEHPEILGFHPLMSFSDQLYPVEFYQSIPFVGSASQAVFNIHFPDWKNPYYQIAGEHKAIYHALCALAGNGTTILWQQVSEAFKTLGLPPESLYPYLKMVTQMIEKQTPSRFTGPWYRGDQKSVETHLQALQDSPLLDLYRNLHALAQTRGESR